MNEQIENPDLIRRYLLGELSDEQREQIERRLLSDEDFYEQVLIAEDELIYDFVSEELPDQDKLSFNQHVMPVPERRQDVKFARALRKYVKENAPRPAEVGKRASWLESLAAFFRRPVVGFALAAVLLASLALSTWMATQNRNLRNQIAQIQSRTTPATGPPQDLQEQLASERQRNADLTDELRREQEWRAGVERDLKLAQEQARQASVPRPTTTPQTGGPAVLSFLLTSGAVRGSEETNTISLPSGAHAIRLQLDMAANEYRSYRAVLKTVEGDKELLSRKMLRARDRRGRITVSMNLPAELLSRGDYKIQLDGETAAGGYEDVDTYYFRVVR